MFEYRGVSRLKHFLATLFHQDSTDAYKCNDFLFKFYNPNKKPQTEILKEDIKSEVMGKRGLEKPEDSILNNTS